MTTVYADGVALGIESFGDEDAPLVLLPGGMTMLSGPDALCERLAGEASFRAAPRRSQSIGLRALRELQRAA
jgi:hypothetical protein